MIIVQKCCAGIIHGWCPWLKNTVELHVWLLRPTQAYYIGDKGAGATRTMAATSFGQIDHFDPDNEGTEAYLERVELYFQANGIADAKRVPVFLSVIRGKNYALLRDLLVPANRVTRHSPNSKNP